MARSLGCSSLVSVFTLVILVSLPVASLCKEETYKPMVKRKAECCASEDAELKRFDDIDYDSFVSLMGRRSAAEANRPSFPCPEDYQQTKSRFINRGRQRSQHTL